MFQTIEPLILASGSPRRRQFFSDAGLRFTVQTAEVDERLHDNEPARHYVRRVALEKAQTVAEHHPESWVVGADTAVVCDELVLGKPAGADEALEMLNRLNHRWHRVITGVALVRIERGVHQCWSVETEVRFAQNPIALLRAYVETGEPLDKAGGYGIQGRGGFLIDEIRGSYSNVVGLPLSALIAELTRQKVIAPSRQQ